MPAALIGPHLPLIRQAFANPLALKRLSDTTCAIDERMLSLCQPVEMPVRWSLFRQLCRNRKTSDFSLGGITHSLNCFPDNDIGQRIRKLFRRASSVADLNKAHRTKAHRTANWLRMHWFDLVLPSVQDALGNLISPFPETETIRLLNRPQELLRNPDPVKRANTLAMTEYSGLHVPTLDSVATRASHIENLGITGFDALHIAAAEAAGCDYLVTTDDRLFKKSKRHADHLKVSALNPIDIISLP